MTTTFPSMDIQAQLQMFKMMQEAIVQLNELGSWVNEIDWEVPNPFKKGVSHG